MRLDASSIAVAPYHGGRPQLSSRRPNSPSWAPMPASVTIIVPWVLLTTRSHSGRLSHAFYVPRTRRGIVDSSWPMREPLCSMITGGVIELLGSVAARRATAIARHSAACQ